MGQLLGVPPAERRSSSDTSGASTERAGRTTAGTGAATAAAGADLGLALLIDEDAGRLDAVGFGESVLGLFLEPFGRPSLRFGGAAGV